MDRPGGLNGLLARCRFPAAGTEVDCAVSGGADSLALLVLAVEAGLIVTAVHVDHGLRPGSANEADVVASAAQRFGAGFRSERVHVGDGPNLEARARAARLAVLGPEALTGHTADDQAETLLINLMRGSGLDGLAGMAPGGTHPILGLRRSDTHDVCAALQLVPVADPSNDDARFVRNRVRHELLPLMADISQRDLVPLLLRTSDHARSAGRLVDGLAAELDPTDVHQLRAAEGPVADAALRRWLRSTALNAHPPSSADLDRVRAVVAGDAVACEIAGGRRVSRRQGTLRVDPARPEDPGR